MALLATKLLLAPLCVIGVSLAGRRWGVAVAGILGSLPVVAGPILLVLTLQHGRSFGSDAATGTLLGLAALTIFVVVYDRLAGRRLAPAWCLVAGWVAFLVGVALLEPIGPVPGAALAFAAASFALGLYLLPAPPRPLGLLLTPPWWDLPARGISALVLVLALTGLSGSLGPGLSGLLAPFPVITSVLVFFTYTHGGRDQLRVLSRNFLVGFYGFAAFCFVLAVVLPDTGTAAAFALALAVALAVQAGVHALRQRRARGRPVPPSAQLDRELGEEAVAGLEQRQVGAADD